WRLQPFLLEEVLAVNEELNVRIHRHRVLRALERARRDGRWNEIGRVERLHALVERQEKLRQRWNPRLVHEQDVVPAARAQGEELLLVQVTERRGVDDDLDARLLLELRQVRAQHV